MRSDLIKKGFDKTPHRSLLKATGVIKDDSDFDKPFIGVCNSYIDLIPGHVHLQEFGRVVKEEIRKAGGVPFEFNTIGVDDGIAIELFDDVRGMPLFPYLTREVLNSLDCLAGQ